MLGSRRLSLVGSMRCNTQFSATAAAPLVAPSIPSSNDSRTTLVQQQTRGYRAKMRRRTKELVRGRRYHHWHYNQSKRLTKYRRCQSCGAPARIGFVCMQCLEPPPSHHAVKWSDHCDTYMPTPDHNYGNDPEINEMLTGRRIAPLDDDSVHAADPLGYKKGPFGVGRAVVGAVEQKKVKKRKRKGKKMASVL